MSKDKIIEILEGVIESQKQQLKEQQAMNKRLLEQVNELTERIASLEAALTQKQAEADKEKKAKKCLAKLLKNESEQQQKAKPESQPRPKSNNGAKRKDDYELEVEEVEVNPTDPDFDPEKARLYQTHDVVRYVMVPMKFKKIIYHCKIYSQDGILMEGKAPLAPLQNSHFDGSFIAGIAQLRYIYSMPIERIIHLFNENGFDLQKPTAHGLLKKVSNLFENLHKALRVAVLSDSYIGIDETYKNVLVPEKNSKGKGIRKGYVWNVTAHHHRLTYFFYQDGSRSENVAFSLLDGYHGTFQSDALRAYRKLERTHQRLSCCQHNKRKFNDCGDDKDALAIVGLFNELYRQEHKHRIGVDGWTVEDNFKWRQRYAPPILCNLKARLEKIAKSKTLLPTSDLANAVNYTLTEWEGLVNIFSAGDYELDNNLIERQNRYISLSRRNSLFFGSHVGAERGVIFYSLACSCRLHGINFFEYISDIINKAAYLPPTTSIEIYRNMLPDRWKISDI
ncbi:MAG: IS66 family transposase [Bacteroidales bacterium]|nr:IS66 family transposase [Bacteroidales bacterium]